jgi:hypothetical protein
MSSSELTIDRLMFYASLNQGLELGLHKASRPGKTPGASGEIRIGMCKWMTLLLTTIQLFAIFKGAYLEQTHGLTSLSLTKHSNPRTTPTVTHTTRLTQQATCATLRNPLELLIRTSPKTNCQSTIHVAKAQSVQQTPFQINSTTAAVTKTPNLNTTNLPDRPSNPAIIKHLSSPPPTTPPTNANNHQQQWPPQPTN